MIQARQDKWVRWDSLVPQALQGIQELLEELVSQALLEILVTKDNREVQGRAVILVPPAHPVSPDLRELTEREATRDLEVIKDLVEMLEHPDCQDRLDSPAILGSPELSVNRDLRVRPVRLELPEILVSPASKETQDRKGSQDNREAQVQPDQLDPRDLRDKEAILG